MLSFANATGNLFNRWGKCGLIVKEAYAYQSAQLPYITDTTTGLVAQYNSESDIQAMAGNSYLSLLSAVEPASQLAQRMAEATINRMIFRDNPQPGQTLTTYSTLNCILEVIRQMQVAQATVLQMTVSSSTSSFIGTGNGVISISTKRPYDGRTLENAFSETLKFLCTSDSYSGKSTAYNELFSVTGGSVQTDVFAFNWPQGSACSKSLNAIDGDSNATDGNILTNSNFATWSSNIPTSWSLVNGVGGTDIVQNNSITYGTSGSSLQIAGDGATLIDMRQTITGNLSTQSQYSVCIFLRRDSVAASTGTLVIDLVDGNGNVISDNAQNVNSFSIDLTALTTSFQGFVGQFRTPSILPSAYAIRIRESVALQSGRSVYAAKMSLGNMTQTYTSGPFVAVHSGAIPFQTGDYCTGTITNSRGSGGTLSTFQTLMFQFFPQMLQYELMLPSSATPTISDSLIG